MSAAEAPRRRNWIFLVPVGLFVGLALLFLLRLGGGDPSQVPSALIDKPAPVVDLPPVEGLLANGKPVPGLSHADFKGRVTLVNVWGSWCGPCRQEHPFLMELARDPSIRLVGINQRDTPENARRFLGALGNPFAAVGADPRGRASIEWGVYGVPETFIVGPDATIRHKQIGPLTAENIEGFRSALRAATP